MVKDYYKDLKIVGANRIKDEIFLKANKKWWIKADAAMKYIDRDMYYSGSGKRVYMPIESLDLKLENRELTSYLIGNLDKINMPVRVIDGIKYLEIEQLENIYPVRHAYYAERGVHVLVNNEMGLKTGITSESVRIMEDQNAEGLEVGKLKRENWSISLEQRIRICLSFPRRGHLAIYHQPVFQTLKRWR